MKRPVKGDIVEIFHKGNDSWITETVDLEDEEGFWIKPNGYFYYDDHDWRRPLNKPAAKQKLLVETETDLLLCEVKSLRGNLTAQKQKFKRQIKGLEASLKRRHDESRTLKKQRKEIIESIDKLEGDLDNVKADLKFERGRKLSSQSELASLKTDFSTAKDVDKAFPKAGDYVEIRSIPRWGGDWRKNQVTVSSTYLDSKGKLDNCFVVKGSDYQFNCHNLGTNWRVCSQHIEEGYPKKCYDANLNLKDPGAGYRWLKIGEEIVKGDEVYLHVRGRGGWEKSCLRGAKVGEGYWRENTYRREIKDETKPEEPKTVTKPLNHLKKARSLKKGDIIRSLLNPENPEKYEYQVISVHTNKTISVRPLTGPNTGKNLENFFSFESLGKSWEFTGKRVDESKLAKPKTFYDLKVGDIIETKAGDGWVDSEVIPDERSSPDRIYVRDITGQLKGMMFEYISNEQGISWRFKD